MSSGASKSSPKAANSDANLHDKRSETFVPSLTRERLSDITDDVHLKVWLPMFLELRSLFFTESRKQAQMFVDKQ